VHEQHVLNFMLRLHCILHYSTFQVAVRSDRALEADDVKLLCDSVSACAKLRVYEPDLLEQLSRALNAPTLTKCVALRWPMLLYRFVLHFMVRHEHEHKSIHP
jgi:hypothetical protein